MPRILASSLAVSLLLAASAPAAAQTVDPDVRCLMVSNAFAQKETDPGRKELAFASTAYYLGRIDTRLNAAQIKASVVAIAKEPIGTSIGQTMTNCAKALQAKQVSTAQMIQAIGQSLVKPAAAAAAKPK